MSRVRPTRTVLSRALACLALVTMMLASGALSTGGGAVLASDAVPKLTYYVATTGSDINPGTAELPWLTVGKGLVSLAAGDTLVVRGGTYRERIQSPVISAGTPEHPVTVKAHAGERPVIQGLFWMRNASHWTFDGINVTWDDATGSPNEHMVKMTNGVGWTFKNGEVWGARSYAGVLVAGSVTGQPSDWSLTGNCVHDTYPSNLTNQDHNVYVNSGLTAGPGLIERNILFGATNGEAVKLGGPSATSGGTTNVTVRYNTMHNSSQNMLLAWQSNNNVIERNILGQVGGSYPNIRGYQLTGAGNTARDTVGYAAAALLKNDSGTTGVGDGGGNRFPADPLHDSTSSCTGFVPQDPQLASYGRYAAATDAPVAGVPAPGADTTAPTVTARAPAGGATGIATSTSVQATFSEAVEGVSPGTFTLVDALGAAVNAGVTYDAAGSVATLQPSADLTPGATYTASVTGGAAAVRDAAGNSLTSTSWTFATAPADTTAPTVTARTPASAASNVAVTSNLSSTFSEAVQGVDAGTFTLTNDAGTPVPAIASYDSGTRAATLDPSADLLPNTRYTATLTGGTAAIRDAAGNPLTTTSWTFTTDPPPTVTSRTPASGATGVSRTANITATFSEAVTAVSASTFTVRKKSGGAAFAATVSRNGTTNQWILDPSTTLPSKTQFTVTLTGGPSAIRDAAGNPLATTSWNFTSGS